ncbi:ABC transporter permease [Propylenella binzhouense]|uniref:ABC transporter permease n=1 Tax=Propylenella binzhouense TaxID=2555902 RepID=A0A964T4T3_9HYPH|nr:ABC transporter permease [Propylenella binzhouense]MYZ48463.1 ABC transporter permease [Propylenella binzhouense]
MMRASAWALESGAFVMAVALGVVAASMVLLATGTPVYQTLAAIYSGALGSAYALQSSLVYAVPVAFTGLAACVAFRARIWNIGGEGQMVMGAFGAALVALHVPLPGPAVLPAMILSGMAFGALWAFGPAVLKVAFGVNEVLSTLMLNYVAILFVDFLVFGPWRDPAGGWPYSPPFPSAALLPALSADLNVAVVAAPVIAVLLAVLFRYTPWGYATAVLGHSHPAARYAGMRIGRLTVQVMLLSGAIAALAGIDQVAGTAGLLYHLPPGYGYFGILVSWLAGHNPLLVLVMATFYGVLLQGGDALQIAQVDPSLVRIMQGAIIIFALAGLTLARRRSLSPGAGA